MATAAQATLRRVDTDVVLQAIIAVVAGSLGGSAVTARANRWHQLREHMLAAADDYVTGVIQAASKLEDLFESVDPATASTQLEEYRRLAREVAARRARVFLLFGVGSPVGELARGMQFGLGRVDSIDGPAFVRALRGVDQRDTPKLRDNLVRAADRTYDDIERFARHAWSAVQKPGRRRRLQHVLYALRGRRAARGGPMLESRGAATVTDDGAVVVDTAPVEPPDQQ